MARDRHKTLRAADAPAFDQLVLRSADDAVAIRRHRQAVDL